MADDALLRLASELGQQLLAKKRMLTLAESCTGGLVSGLMTEIAGSSQWFDSGYVVYSNQAKQDMLGVSLDTLKAHGAVSEEVAKEMALGAINNCRANIAVSITGIAGPDGGTPQKPVGTVCFAWAGTGLPTQATTMHFVGNRQEVRQQSVLAALQGVAKLLAADAP